MIMAHLKTTTTIPIEDLIVLDRDIKETIGIRTIFPIDLSNKSSLEAMATSPTEEIIVVTIIEKEEEKSNTAVLNNSSIVGSMNEGLRDRSL